MCLCSHVCDYLCVHTFLRFKSNQILNDVSWCCRDLCECVWYPACLRFVLLSIQCPAVFLAVQRCRKIKKKKKLAWEVWEHFPLTNRGKSIASRLREPLSIWRWADSAVPAARRGWVGGTEMIALQAVKCTALLRTLCGRCATRLLNPLVKKQDRGESESSHMHAWLVNTRGGSLLSCGCHGALPVSLSLTCSLSIYTNAVDSSTGAHWSQKPKFLFFSPGLCTNHIAD